MVKIARTLACLVLALAVTGLAGVGARPAVAASAAERPLLVFAAASLKNALDAAAERFRAEQNRAVTVSYAASSALARQIEAGAPADVFISADRDWMDYLAHRDLIDAGTQRNLLGNGLVLIAPRTAPVDLRIAPGMPLAAALGTGRLAMANTAAVPAGRYGKAALETLGVWTTVTANIAQAESVRAALALVAHGEAPLGIVYRSDAAAEPDVVVVDTFPAQTHPPIIYPIAVVADSDHDDARGLVQFLASNAARPHFVAQGFVMLPHEAGF